MELDLNTAPNLPCLLKNSAFKIIGRSGVPKMSIVIWITDSKEYNFIALSIFT